MQKCEFRGAICKQRLEVEMELAATDNTCLPVSPVR